MNYLGKVDGEAFDGGAAEDAELVLGSGRFIPGFEDQLVGVKAGDEKTITVTFPADYPAANLAGKEANFGITVKVVGKRPGYLTLSKTSAAKVPAGIKYANCAALTKDYPGGVAKSSTTIDKIAGVPGGGILSTTYVSSKLYTLNAARDGDMDGWACE